MAGVQTTQTEAQQLAAQGAPSYQQGPQSLGSVPGPLGVPGDYYTLNPDGSYTKHSWAAGPFPDNRPPGSPVASSGYGTNRYVNPTFFEGDEIAPASWGPARIADLQRALAAAGLIKLSDVQLGYWDQATQDAYKEVLIHANRAGITNVMAAFGDLMATRQQYGAPSQNLPVTVTNPDDLKKAFRQAMVDQVGHVRDAGQIDRMVQAYQQTERDYQQQQYAAQQAGTGGTLTAPASPAAFAEAEAVRTDKPGVEANTFRQLATDFFNMIGKWQG